MTSQAEDLAGVGNNQHINSRLPLLQTGITPPQPVEARESMEQSLQPSNAPTASPDGDADPPSSSPAASTAGAVPPSTPASDSTSRITDEDVASITHLAFSAVSRGEDAEPLAALQRMLPPLLDTRDAAGHTLLHVAAAAGNVAAAGWLLGARPDLARAQDDAGFCPVHTAAGHNHPPMLDLLRHSSSSLDLKDALGRTALSIAAAAGATRTVQALVETHNARVNSRDRFGNTALHWAVANGHLDCVKTLVKLGSDVHPVCYSGKSALDLADERGHAAIHTWLSDLLRDLRALSAAVKRGDIPVATSVLRKAKLLVRDADGRTALHVAAGRGQDAAVNLLLNENYRCTERDKFHRLPLHLAAVRGHVTTARILVQRARRDRGEAGKTAKAPAAAPTKTAGEGDNAAPAPASAPPSSSGSYPLSQVTLTDRTPEDLARLLPADRAEERDAFVRALCLARALDAAEQSPATTQLQHQREEEAAAWEEAVRLQRARLQRVKAEAKARERAEVAAKAAKAAAAEAAAKARRAAAREAEASGDGGSLSGDGAVRASEFEPEAAVGFVSESGATAGEETRGGQREVAALLAGFGIGSFADAVIGEGFDTKKRLTYISSTDLEQLGVKRGHQRELLDWAQREQQRIQSEAASHNRSQVAHARQQQRAQQQQHAYQQDQQDRQDQRQRDAVQRAPDTDLPAGSDQRSPAEADAFATPFDPIIRAAPPRLTDRPFPPHVPSPEEAEAAEEALRNDYVPRPTR